MRRLAGPARTVGSRFRTAVVGARHAVVAAWALVIALYRRGRKPREGETAAANLLRRLYVFGAVNRSTYEREVGQRRRRKKVRGGRPR